MSDLFESQYMEFLSGDKHQEKEKRREITQNYYNRLAEVFKNGGCYFKDDEDVEYRDLTEKEKEDLLFSIGCWLSSLN